MVDNSGFVGGSGIKAGDNTRYTSVSIFPQADFYDPSSQTTDVHGIAIGDSGTKLYIADPGVGFFQYTMSTPNDITSMSYASISRADASVNTNCSILFNPTGTIVTYAHASNSIRQRTLSTPWDISSAGGATDTSFSSEISNLGGYQFGDNGNKFYIYDNSDGYIEQYTLGTPYTLSTASYASKRFYFRALGYTNSTTCRSILFNSDGSKVYCFNSNAIDGCVIFEFGTNWDVETLSRAGFGLSCGAPTASGTVVYPTNHCWASDGLSVFCCTNGSADQIFQISVDTAYEASNKTTVLNYSGKAVLADLSYAPDDSRPTGSPSNALGNNILTRTFVNVDSAGDRLVSEDEYLEDTSANYNPLAKPQSVNGIAVQSKTNLTVKVESRNFMKVKVKYRIL